VRPFLFGLKVVVTEADVLEADWKSVIASNYRGVTLSQAAACIEWYF